MTIMKKMLHWLSSSSASQSVQEEEMALTRASWFRISQLLLPHNLSKLKVA
jgi:hypothetical protein